MSMSCYNLKDGRTKWIDHGEVHLWEDQIVHPPDPNQSILDELQDLKDTICCYIDKLEPLFERLEDDSSFDFRKPNKQPEAENQTEEPLSHNQPLYSGSGNTKLFQHKIDQDLVEEFGVLCTELGTTQKDMVELWICNLLTEEPLSHNQPLHNDSGNTKLFQTKIDRDLAEKFKVLCKELGITQRDMVERGIADVLGQYNR